MTSHKHNWKNPILKRYFRDSPICLVRDCKCGATIAIDEGETHTIGNEMDYTKATSPAQYRMLMDSLRTVTIAETKG